MEKPGFGVKLIPLSMLQDQLVDIRRYRSCSNTDHACHSKLPGLQGSAHESCEELAHGVEAFQCGLPEISDHPFHKQPHRINRQHHIAQSHHECGERGLQKTQCCYWNGYDVVEESPEQVLLDGEISMSAESQR